jgi:predicted RNase H-like HicB family nuclease
MNDKYLVVIEQADDGSYSAYLPDVPGCVSCGDTVDEVKVLIQEALDFHFDCRYRHQPQSRNMSKPSPLKSDTEQVFRENAYHSQCRPLQPPSTA